MLYSVDEQQLSAEQEMNGSVGEFDARERLESELACGEALQRHRCSVCANATRVSASRRVAAKCQNTSSVTRVPTARMRCSALTSNA